MSCNCNTANPTCEPCMICTPSGVTNLQDCNPVDPCEGNQVNGSCVKYTGIDFDCIGVYGGDDIFQVMFAILQYYQPVVSGECCDMGDGTIEYAPPLTTTTTSTTTTSTTTTTTAAPVCVYYEIINTNKQGPSTVEYVPCNSEEYIDLEVEVSEFVCINYDYPINLISGTVKYETWGPCDDPAPFTTTTTTTVSCECTIYTVENLLNEFVKIYYTECNNGKKTYVSLSILPYQTISVCACSNILDNTSRFLNINATGTPCTDNPNITTTTSTTTTSTSTTSTTSTSTTTTTTTIVSECNCYTIENPTAGFLGYEWGDCDTFGLEYSTVAPETIAYRCSLSTLISVSPGLILTNLGPCSLESSPCNPPLEIFIGESIDEVCLSSGSPITVVGNTPSFCDSTEFHSNDFLSLLPGLYYLYNSGYSILIEVDGINSTLTALSPCTPCTTTTTTGEPTTTTTSTTSTTTTTTVNFLFGRRATIPVPVQPSSNLVIAYFDTNGDPQTLTIPAQASPSNYYLCVDCGSEIVILSGTPPGTITYDDLGPVDCNCII